MSNESVAQRRAVKIWFDDQDMDYYLMLALANATASGAEFGECFYTASRIKEHDPSSWVNNWSETAQRVGEMARASLAQGHQLSAREAFLRAYTYYRCATIFIRVQDPQYRRPFQNGGKLLRFSEIKVTPILEWSPDLILFKQVFSYCKSWNEMVLRHLPCNEVQFLRVLPSRRLLLKPISMTLFPPSRSFARKMTENQ